MARIFSECVILRSPVTGEPTVFMPGSPVPGWAESLVTNPAATVGLPDEVTTGTDEGTNPKVETPPASRPYGNAPKNEWADYATGLGVEIPDGATKNEIIALVDELPTTE